MENEYSRKFVKDYARTAIFMMKKATADVLGKDTKLIIDFNYGDNYFAYTPGHELTEEDVEKIEKQMHADVEKMIPITEKDMRVEDAQRLMTADGRPGKAHALHYRPSSYVSIDFLGNRPCYFGGDLLENSARITRFELVPFEGGMMLVLPSKEDPMKLNPVLPAGKLFRVQSDSICWAARLGIISLADISDRIVDGSAKDVVMMQEAYFEKQLGDVAQNVVRQNKRVILLAGPSSSGKTTTAYRLAIQLRAYGLKPVPISADDYFLPNERRPLLPDGRPDMESIRAVDTELFNTDMVKLLDGEEIDLPTFNFQAQQREYRGEKLRMEKKTVLIVEGIHCLNPVFSEKLPEESKIRIYISALTPLRLDSMNPISTAACRLLRRIVRDYRTRNYSAAQTISVWPDVRKGEEENIFPWQENADVILNTSMIYELAVLKPYVEPLLYGIYPDQPEYSEARRLIKFLSAVLSMPADAVPGNSILREFIGGSVIDI